MRANQWRNHMLCCLINGLMSSVVHDGRDFLDSHVLVGGMHVVTVRSLHVRRTKTSVGGAEENTSEATRTGKTGKSGKNGNNGKI